MAQGLMAFQALRDPTSRRNRSSSRSRTSVTVMDCRREAANSIPNGMPSNGAATLSATLSPGCWVTPSTAAAASGTAAGSPTAASSITNTPSGKVSANRTANSIASRVLPTPPTPVSVTNRCAFSTDSNSASSDSRPMKLVVGGRRFPGVGSTVFNGGKSLRRSALGLERHRRV